MAPLIYLDTHVLAWLYAGQIERIPAPDLGLKVCGLPFPEVARRAFALSWTRDPFDRLIVSQASLQEAPLVTKDGDIHEHYRGALWTKALAPMTEPRRAIQEPR